MAKSSYRGRAAAPILQFAAVALLAVSVLPAQVGPVNEDLPTTIGNVRAKAEPDDCFFALGSNLLPFLSPPCPPLNRPKVNQSYPWALTEAASGDKIIIGTAANPHCIAQAAFGVDTPYQTGSWACEFGSSPYAVFLPPAPQFADLRPPQILAYDKGTGTVTDITPVDANPFGVIPEIIITRGIRFAVTIGNLVLVGGPTILGDVNLFAFKADTLEYLGSGTLPGLSHIRKAVIVDGELYVAIGKPTGGEVLHWTGSIAAAPCTTCFDFEVVGELDGIGGSIAEHEGRLFVTTWPIPSVLGGLYMSPPIPSGGLTSDDADDWVKVWDAADYEPDPAIVETYAGGDLASFEGYLYWGTMHVPTSEIGAFLAAYPPPADEDEALAVLLGTFRATTLFRGMNLGTGSEDIELLYGAPQLPVYTGGPGLFELQDNNMPANRRDPLFGLPGIISPWNNYSWALKVWDGRLWIGTMDKSFSSAEATGLLALGLGGSWPAAVGTFFGIISPSFGADLAFISNKYTPAYPESFRGLGNFTNWGIRNLLVSENLFAGMTNPSNLLTDPNDILPEGGWELIELEPKPRNTFPGVFEKPPLDDDVRVEFCRVEEGGITKSTIVPNFFLDFPEEIIDLLKPILGEPPDRFDEVEELFLILSTADWQENCNRDSLAKVCLPVPDAAPNLQVHQLQWLNGKWEWIPLEASTMGDHVCGEVTSTQLGLFAVFTVNLPPVADAGPDQDFPLTTSNSTLVTLDGSGSTDYEGGPLSYLWKGPFGTETGVGPTVSLPPGKHTITLTVTDPEGASDSDTVEITIPGLEISPNSFTFVFDKSTATQELRIRAIGGSANYLIPRTASWLETNPESGSSSGETDRIDVIVDPSGYRAGTYTTNLVVRSGSNVAKSIPVTMIIGEGFVPTPTLSEHPAVDAADYIPFGEPGHAMAPQSLIAIYGSGFIQQGKFEAATIPLPTQLGGVSVTFDGIPGGLFLVMPGLIHAQLPGGVTGPTATLVVTNDLTKAVSESREIEINDYSPGIFTLSQDGLGQAIATFPGTMDLAAPVGTVGNSRPATAGDYLTIWANGVGPVDPEIEDGHNSCDPDGLCLEDGSNIVLHHNTTKPTIRVGGVEVPEEDVAFSGFSVESVAINEIVFRVPAGTPTGPEVPLTIEAGGVVSLEVTIAVE